MTQHAVVPARQDVLPEGTGAISAPGSAPPSDAIDLRELGRKLWRRKGLILTATAAVATLALLVVFQLAPVYRATAYVMLDPRPPSIVQLHAVLAGLPSDDETVRSEVLVIRSRELARKVVEKRALDKNPEFNRRLQPSLWAKFPELRRWLPEDWAAALLGPTEPAAREDREAHEAMLSRTVDEFLRRLSVEPEPRSRVIRISLDAADPHVAAAALNTLVDLYIVAQVEAKFEATKRANAWLSEHLAGLRNQVVASERAVEEFRAHAGLLRSKDSTIAAQEISGIGNQLIQAQADRAASEAKVAQLSAMAGSPAALTTIGEVLQSPLIQTLREQQAQAERRMAELSTQFGDEYPKIIEARAEIRGLQQKIDVEIAKIIRGLQNQVVVARSREASLGASLEERKQKLAVLDASQVQLKALERDADASRALYDNLLARFKETSSQSDDLLQPDARIVSRAEVPLGPVFPNASIVAPLALALGLAVGLALAFTVERLDQGFRSMDQVEQATSLPALGLVPAVAPRALRSADFIENDRTNFAESIRNLGTKLLLLDPERVPRTLLVTSSLPKEGKSAVAVALACMQAVNGRKVAFLDCDLRKPSAHLALHVPLKPGLVEFLSGKASLDEATHRDQRTGIDVIPAGEATRNPAGLLASEAMTGLLRTLAQSHDLVVADSAPVLSVADALPLARAVDKTLFLIRWAESRRTHAVKGIAALAAAGASIAGIVLSRVDVRKHARYGYADSGLYYARSSYYYGRK